MIIGKLVLEADGKEIHTTADISFRGQRDIYKLICCIAEQFDVNTTEKWAELTIYAMATLGQFSSQNGKSTKTVIKIPNINKKENNYD